MTEEQSPRASFDAKIIDWGKTIDGEPVCEILIMSEGEVVAKAEAGGFGELLALATRNCELARGGSPTDAQIRHEERVVTVLRRSAKE